MGQKLELENFSTKLANMKFSPINCPLQSSLPHNSYIVNSQTGLRDSEYVVVLDPQPTSHVT